MQHMMQDATQNLSNAACWPDVVVLEHYHRRQIMAMCWHATHQQWIFFNKSETRCCFPRPCHFTMPTVFIGQLPQPPSNRCYAACSCQAVQSNSLTQQYVPHLTTLTSIVICFHPKYKPFRFDSKILCESKYSKCHQNPYMRIKLLSCHALNRHMKTFTHHIYEFTAIFQTIHW